MLAPRSRAGPIGSTLGCWAAAMTVHPAIRVVASVTVRRMVERLLCWLGQILCYDELFDSANCKASPAGSQVAPSPSGTGPVRLPNRVDSEHRGALVSSIDTMNLRDVKLRLRALFAPGRVERELDEELSFHVERETQKLIDEGMTPAEARAESASALRIAEPWPPTSAATNAARLRRNTVRDVLYALRTFRRAPLTAFTIVVDRGDRTRPRGGCLQHPQHLRVPRRRGTRRSRDVRRRTAAKSRWRPECLHAAREYDACGAKPASSPMSMPNCPRSTLRVDGRMMAVTLVIGQLLPGRRRPPGPRPRPHARR